MASLKFDPIDFYLFWIINTMFRTWNHFFILLSLPHDNPRQLLNHNIDAILKFPFNPHPTPLGDEWGSDQK